jgi:hypothetical protein
MKKCVEYIFERQIENKIQLVSTIYAEEWVLKMLPSGFWDQKVTKFEKWPPENITPISLINDKQHG